LSNFEVANLEITYSPGVVDFKGYRALMNSAQQLVAELQNVEVTPENVKESKRLRAAVNKRLHELSDKRIEIKNAVLQPYDQFQNQLKEITDVVSEANKIVDSQIRELDEIERVEKTKQVESIFDQHRSMYDDFPFGFGELLDDEPSILNKTYSTPKAEQTIAEWINGKQQDIKVIKTLPNSKEVMTEYLGNGGLLSSAMATVSTREEQEVKAKEIIQKSKARNEVQEFHATFTVFDEKDAEIIEMFIETHNIKFKKEVY